MRHYRVIADADTPGVARWAHVRADGVVDNVSLWDGVEYDPKTGRGWTPPDEVNMHKLSDDSPVGPGWTYDGTKFAPPVEPDLAPRVSDFIAQAQKASTTGGKVNALLAAVQALAGDTGA